MVQRVVLIVMVSLLGLSEEVSWCHEIDVTGVADAIPASSAVALAPEGVVPTEKVENKSPQSLSSVSPPWSVGIDYYWGVTGQGSERTRFRDGFWAGSGIAFPSNAALQWQGQRGQKFRLALGLGDLHNGQAALLHQPLEAYFQMPVRSSTLTVGKFFVPFGVQEWEYESKTGVMLQKSTPRWDHALAATYNSSTKRSNYYMRHAFKSGESTSVGVSLAKGEGWTYNSSHRSGWGGDVSHSFGKWQGLAEFLKCHGDSGDMDFAFVKLTYTGGKRLTPYVGFYRWSDEAEELGDFRSAVVGATYQLTRLLSVEGGYADTMSADTSDKGRWWLQLRLQWNSGQG